MAKKLEGKDLTDVKESVDMVTDNNKKLPATALNQQESVYSIEDLARAARVRLGVLPEIVYVAMQEAGKNEATLTEAENIVEKFMTREVK